MKILQILCRYQERGGEQDAVESLGRLLRRRHTVEELYFDNAEWAGAGGVRRLLLPFLFLWNGKAVRRFRDRMSSFQPDLIVVHNTFPSGSAGILIEALGSAVPVVYYIHNFRPFSVNAYCWADGRIEPGGLNLNFYAEIKAGAWQNSRFRTALFAGVLWLMHAAGVWKRIPCWIAISHFMREKFIEAGVPPDRIHTLYYAREYLSEPGNGEKPDADAKPESEVEKEAMVPGGPRFLYLGRLSEEKGVLLLVRAWELYLRAGGTGQLTIAGAGPLAGELERLTAGMARITVPGQVRGAVKDGLLRDCTAVVIPSLWWEAFGLVVYDAYSYRKPVLVAASGGLTEMVVEGETGWIHEPGNAEQLCGHFLKAGEDPAECARRGRKGRVMVELHGQVDRWLDDFERITSPLLPAPVSSVE